MKWYQPCNSKHFKHFKNDFNKWTSGNDAIDKFIQDAQLNANSRFEALEWIPYDGLEYIKQIAKWIDGPIINWDIENQQWKRSIQYEVVLKKMSNNSFAYNSIQFFGITQDPETQKYMMYTRIFVLEIFSTSNLCVTDFGLSKLIGSNPKRRLFSGVLPYVAPEVLSGEEYTKAADVYSFGIIAYEIITGIPPPIS
ncbi:hypothetical protein Glove_203g46 [Diversispora epigaea]|uniref:Protein kinase domain-containing protein n=1 Tax=Diversispora epigaea TaxID=1348612 RepID=A0A397IJS0_9GLOM|nr:hypothetical protein Glove_203g46 [Diversispora epigaea]